MPLVVALHDARADTADEFGFAAGPARRLVAQPGPEGFRAVSSLPGGTSETRGSATFANLLRRWLTNDTYPIRTHPEDAELDAATTTHFQPAQNTNRRRDTQ